jgi:hypothetical protein
MYIFLQLFNLKVKMSKRKYTQISLKEKEKIIEIMSRLETINLKTGTQNF